jgi:hypothetical protein
MPQPARRTDLPQIADRQSGLRLVALLVLACLPARAVQAEDDGQWTQPGKDFAATRFSELDQITVANVGQLRSVWNFSTGVLSGHEGQPLVVNGTMYVVTPYPNVLYAFDLTKEDYPLRFKYRPDVNPASVGIACCDSVNRGAVYAEGKIVYNLLDGRTVAVDAQTGQEVWKATVGRSLARRDDHDGALWSWAIACSWAPREGVRNSRLVQGARSGDREARVGGAQSGPGQRRAGEARHLQILL